ncbi:MAG: NADH-quinone oxidoreductase subunit C [Chloroflexi bacterium]|nr:NADH-quinone oxidoreductase subunit C [Chloroflexota bacterium]
MMNDHLSPVATAFSQKFNARVLEFRGEVTLLLPSDRVTDAALLLRDEFGFDMLTAETAVDYYPQTDPRFHVIYIFYSTTLKVYLNFRVPIHGDEAKIKTMENVFPSANWREREIFDLMGIQFEGHSDLRRLLMPPNWEGHPLRKDYPLGYEEVQFTFNMEEIDVQKPKGVRQ